MPHLVSECDFDSYYNVFFTCNSHTKKNENKYYSTYHNTYLYLFIHLFKSPFYFSFVRYCLIDLYYCFFFVSVNRIDLNVVHCTTVQA